MYVDEKALSTVVILFHTSKHACMKKRGEPEIYKLGSKVMWLRARRETFACLGRRVHRCEHTEA